MPFVCFFETVVSTTQLKFLRHRFPQWDHSLFFSMSTAAPGATACKEQPSVSSRTCWLKKIEKKIHHKNMLLFQACPFPECSQEPTMPLQEKSWKGFQPAAQWKIISLQTSAAWITIAFQDFQRSTVHPVVSRVAPRPASRFFCCLASF